MYSVNTVTCVTLILLIPTLVVFFLVLVLIGFGFVCLQRRDELELELGRWAVGGGVFLSVGV